MKSFLGEVEDSDLGCGSFRAAPECQMCMASVKFSKRKSGVSPVFCGVPGLYVQVHRCRSWTVF